MIRMEGKGVSAGTVKGRLCFLKRPKREALRRERMEPQGEIIRFRRARQEAVDQLNALAERVRMQAGEQAAALFETHALLAEDEDYGARVEQIISQRGCSAEYAAEEAGGQFARLLSDMDDAYMRERSADVRDVARRIADVLTGGREAFWEASEPVVLAADDLAPSETVRLQRERVLAILTRGGSGSSHTAILARTMGIPAVCALGDALKEGYEGQIVYVDGESGEVLLEPDAAALTRFEQKQARRQERAQALAELRGQPNVTPDGRSIEVLCNIGSLEDIPAVLENDGQGVGLFRSEFLYLAAQDFPDEEVQFHAYRSAAQALAGRRLIIRTLDAGADKQAAYFGMKPEENPALGLRGVRFCLSRPEVFRTQLRALYRATAYGRIAILFPMITSVREVQACRSLCAQVMRELDEEGVTYDSNAEIGVMIETPASVFIAEELARWVDFFSVGTNDLTQYLLACDRQAGDMAGVYDALHPAVIRAIGMAAEAAHRAGVRIGVCGELGANPAMLHEFLRMGIDELSVSPASVLPLRMEIRRGAEPAGS